MISSGTRFKIALEDKSRGILENAEAMKRSQETFQAAQIIQDRDRERYLA